MYRLKQAVDTVNTAHNIQELVRSTQSELVVPHKPVNLCGFRCFRLQSQKQKEFLRPFFPPLISVFFVLILHKAAL